MENLEISMDIAGNWWLVWVAGGKEVRTKLV